MKNKVVPLGLGLVFLCVQGAVALDDGDGTSNVCNHFNALNNPYFGDTHVHTTYSVDAFAGGTDTTPGQAYDFAQGALLGLHPFDAMGEPGRSVQLERQLDFAMVSDHAEYFGEYTICQDPAHPAYSDPNCEVLRARNFITSVVWLGKLGNPPQDQVSRFAFCGPDGSICTDEVHTLWQDTQDAAAAYYDRSADCNFTAFIGYEWTGSSTRTNNQGETNNFNLHRNVVFRNSIVPGEPTSYFDAPYPEQLYDALDTDCVDAQNPGGDCEVLLIPHNSNLSGGATFENINPDGSPYNNQDVIRRNRFERLIEVIQKKGASECLAGGNDELCDFEFIQPEDIGFNHTAVEESTIRGALKKGLQKRRTSGNNPAQFGMVGGTDTHLGTPGNVQESENHITNGYIEAGSDLTDNPQFNAGGLAVIWAPQNSRAALFDAMRRRETYATSGPRHVVRFFGGYELPSDICSQPNFVQAAYDDGVPMGSELPEENPSMASPKFVVSAMKDPGTVQYPGNDLQHIQIIKGWTDSTGTTHELVYEIAGDSSNGAGVDLNTCTNFGSGFTNLCQHWEDPDFDPAENAFYYARVVENPSCRWAQRQCINLTNGHDCGDPETLTPWTATCCDENVPKTVQERSWTSPIWHLGEVSPPGC